MKRIIKVHEDLQSAQIAAGELIVRNANEAIERRNRFLFALSGGDTPTGLYQLFAEPPYINRIDWSKVHFFWGDERIVPFNDAQSNYGQAWKLLLQHLPVRHESLHPIRTDLPPELAEKEYAAVLKQYSEPPLEWPRFDLVLLGLGEDGHTASIFPGSEINISTPTGISSANYQDRPLQRISLTAPVFNSAREIVFLVSGKSKAATLARVLYGGYHPLNLPAQRIQPKDGKVIWLVDKPAASELPERSDM